MPNPYRGQPGEQDALDAFIKLWRAAHAVETRTNRHLSDAGLTASQFAVLEALYHLGPLRQKQLAQKILRSSGNLTMVVDNLVRDRLVSRERDAHDRRVMIVTLTATGHALIARIMPAHVRGIREVFEVLEPGELAQLSALTRKLGLGVQALDTAPPDEAEA